MKIGDSIKVRASRNEILHRTVVAVDQMKVYLCPREEFELARSEGRAPWSIGFPLIDIIGDNGKRKSVV